MTHLRPILAAFPPRRILAEAVAVAAVFAFLALLWIATPFLPSSDPNGSGSAQQAAALEADSGNGDVR